MKIVRYFLYVVIVLVVIFFGMGAANPNVYYESDVLVNKPVAEARIKETIKCLNQDLKILGLLDSQAILKSTNPKNPNPDNFFILKSTNPKNPNPDNDATRRPNT